MSRQWWNRVLNPKSTAIVDACLIGLASGLAAVFLKLGVEWLRGWRVELTLRSTPWLFLPLLGGVGGWLSGCLIERFAPETTGSGVPQVKAALAGVAMPLNGRVALVKLVTSMLALGSGIPLGRQGPTVHIGAALAAQLSRWIPTSPDYRRQMIAAGAAAGLASGFNAPISGVIFATEELLHDISGFSLGPTLLASFIGAVVSQLGGVPGPILVLQVSAASALFSVGDIPSYLVVGLLAGVLGVLFGKGILATITFNRDILHLSLPLLVGLAGLVCGLVVSLLPTEFRTSIGLRDFLIAGGADLGTTATALMVYFTLTIIAAGSGAPGGLFAPSLVLGAALGHLVGIGQEQLLGTETHGIYALTGMGALFCVVYKAPITAVVIIFEMTRNFNLVLPLMIGSAVAYLVSETIDRGSLYDQLQELNGISLKQDLLDSDPLHTLTVRHVMPHHPLQTLNPDQTVDEAIQTFTLSHYHAIPVVNGDQLVGFVTQTDLVKLYHQWGNSNGAAYLKSTPVHAIMTTRSVTVSPADTLNDVLHKVEKYGVYRFPVTEEGRLVGMITLRDIIQTETVLLSSRTLESPPTPADS